MKRGWYWPVIVIGLLVAGVGANLAMLMLATGDPSFSVEPDYYAKAVKWDAHMAQARRNAELGWTAELAALATGPVVRLADRSGIPVSGARVSLEAFPIARGDRIVRAVLEETAEHRYAGTLGLNRPGLWEFRLTAVRGAETFTAVIDQDVPRSAP